jgi:formylglycine-generating enzyme required for sulfatase activity
MNMKKISAFSVSCVLATELLAAASAVPRVDESAVSMEQASDRLVTVSYKLTDAPGIVTIDFQTNSTVGWVSIGAENFQNVGGDVNCIVTELETTKTITWRPEVSWEGHVVTNGLRAVVKAWALDNPPPYMAINLGVDDFIAFYPDAGAVPGGITDDIYKTEWLLMRRIPAANVVWRMGSPLGEIGKNYDDTNNVRETPHLVRLSSDYYMGVYEVTEYQYLRAMNKSLSEIGADKYLMPKNNIKWDDIRGYGSTGKDYEWPKNKPAVSPTSFMGFMRNRWSAAGNFDLPTEAQWEYACRAGCGSALYNGTELDGTKGTTSSNIIAVVGWCKGIVDSRQEVGQKQHNAWGLFDMLGNVEEWCLDWWAQQDTQGVEIYVPGKIYDDPEGPAYDLTGNKSCRGGSYYSNTANVRCAARSSRMQPNTSGGTLGFRVCAPCVITLPVAE